MTYLSCVEIFYTARDVMWLKRKSLVLEHFSHSWIILAATHSSSPCSTPLTPGTKCLEHRRWTQLIDSHKLVGRCEMTKKTHKQMQWQESKVLSWGHEGSEARHKGGGARESLTLTQKHNFRLVRGTRCLALCCLLLPSSLVHSWQTEMFLQCRMNWVEAER